MMFPVMSAVTSHELSSLTFCYSRLSHAIRTPLGISLSVIDDLIAGHTVGRNDLEDARNALRDIVRMFDELRTFTRPPDFNPKLVTGEEIIRCLTSCLGTTPSSLVEQQTADVLSRSTLIDLGLLTALVNACNLWCQARARGSSIFSASWDIEYRSNFELTLTLNGKALGGTEVPMTLAEWAQRDHSTQAIALIFAAEICRLHQWLTKVTSSENATLISISLGGGSYG